MQQSFFCLGLVNASDKHVWHFDAKLPIFWGDTWIIVEVQDNRKETCVTLLKVQIILCQICLSPMVAHFLYLLLWSIIILINVFLDLHQFRTHNIICSKLGIWYQFCLQEYKLPWFENIIYKYNVNISNIYRKYTKNIKHV